MTARKALGYTILASPFVATFITSTLFIGLWKTVVVFLVPLALGAIGWVGLGLTSDRP